MTAEIIHLHRDVAPGEILISENPLILDGSIGDGAAVHTLTGDLHVTGAIGDNVALTSAGSIRLDGDAGNRLRLRCANNAGLRNVGAGADISAGKGISGGDIGGNSNIRCGESLLMAALGPGSLVASGGAVQATRVGHDCHITAAASVNAATLCAYASARAGTLAIVGLAHEFAQVTGNTRVYVRETAGEAAKFVLRPAGKVAKTR